MDDEPASRAEVMAYAKQLLEGSSTPARSPLIAHLPNSEPKVSADEHEADMATPRCA